MIKLLQTGHAIASLEELRRQGLERGVFAVLDAALAPVEGEAGTRRDAFVRLALQDTDRRVAEGRAVAPSFLLACLLWYDVQQRWAAARAQGESPFPALQQAIDAVFDARIGDISGRGRIASDMREIWQMQPRFERRTAATAASLVEQPRFRAGYDFLRLRADVGEVNPELADWWEDYSLGTEEEREALLQDAKARAAPRKSAGRTSTSTPPASVSSAGARVAPAGSGRTDEAHEEVEPGEAPPRVVRAPRRASAGAGAGVVGAPRWPGRTTRAHHRGLRVGKAPGTRGGEWVQPCGFRWWGCCCCPTSS
jgi:poly(A) polymerase